MPADELDDPPELFDFVEQYAADLEAGAPRPLEHYLERFPDHVGAVTREYERLARARSDDLGAPANGAGQGGEPSEGALIGPYRILRQLARGGQGTVYLAEDTRIVRRVALKILTTLFSAIPEGRLLRFRREAEVISKLDHPGICAVFDADLESSVPYLAMRYVEGETLADLLARSRHLEGEGPATAPARGPVCRPKVERHLHRTLEFFELAARALQTAHEAGVVHRDIKPGNLMVAEDGRPVLLDFGLAHDDDAASLTEAGELFGTPAYMAPEQITGRARADPRTDVYGLGVVLYECLALERPFDAPTREALYHAVATGAVSPVRTYNEHLPREVEVVLEKALERDPERRYASASELGQDLLRVRRKLPIGARPAGPLLRLRRWSERHPAIATSVIGALLLLVIGLAVSLVALGKVNAVNARLKASIMGSRSLMLKDDDPTAALLLGVESARSGGGLTANMALLAALTSCHERRTLIGHGDRILDAELVGERGWLITASSDGSALVFELESGRVLARLDGGGAALTAVAAAPEPRDPTRTLVAAGSTDGTARLHLLGSDGRPAAAEQVLAGHTDWVRAVAFDPSGELIATASNDGTLRLYRTRNGEFVRAFDDHQGAVTQISFSPDGTRLLSASGDPSLFTESSSATSDHSSRLFEVATGAALTVLEHAGRVVDASFSPDGQWIGTACEDRAVRVHALDGTLLRTITAGQRAIRCTWSPDGGHLIAIFGDLARIWSADEDSLITLRGGVIRSAAFSPDGARMVTGGLDNSAQVWDVGSGLELAVLTRTASPISECFWTPDGLRIVTSTKGRLAHVWYADSPPGIAVLRGHRGAISTVAFDPAGERVLSASNDRTARIWSRAEGRLLVELSGHAGQVRSALFDPRGERVVTASNDGTARVWDAATGTELAVLTGHRGRVHRAEFSPQGEWIASVATEGGARLWNRDGLPRAELDCEGDEVLRARFSADGRRLATCSSERLVRVFAVPDGTPLARLEAPGEGAVFDLRFVPGSGGRRLATANEDGYVRIWDVEAGAVLARSAFENPGIIDFDPSGAQLLMAREWGGAAAVVDGALRRRPRFLGERSSPAEETQAVAHDMQITAASFSPAGKVCVTASRNETASLWDASSGAPIAHFEGHGGGVLDACFSPDGAWVATGARDGIVRVWPVDPLPAALARLPRELTDEERERYAGPGSY